MKKWIIIILIILIILIAIILILLNSFKSNPKVSKELEIQEESYVMGKENLGLLKEGMLPSKVTSEHLFFTAEQCVKDYIKYINDNDTKAIYSLLDYKYIDENNIKESNVTEYIKKYNNNSKVNKTVEIYQSAGAKYHTYYVKHKIGINNEYFIVNMDISNNRFSIIPIDQEKYEQKIIEKIEGVSPNEDAVKANNYNVINYKYYEEEDVVNKYFQDYLENALYSTNEAFQSLDTEYRQKRFIDFNDYKDYVVKNKAQLELMCNIAKKQYEDFSNYEDYERYHAEIGNNGLKQYQIRQKSGYKECICIDTNGNYYIFKIMNAMEYSLILDIYTIDMPEFIEKYNKATTMEKVGLNIQKCISAINNKDYTYVYNKLDDTFKANKYKTKQDFIKDIQNNLFDINVADEVSSTHEGNTYIYTINIKDKKNNTKTKKMTIIMQLKEETDFVMSFSFE